MKTLLRARCQICWFFGLNIYPCEQATRWCASPVRWPAWQPGCSHRSASRSAQISLQVSTDQPPGQHRSAFRSAQISIQVSTKDKYRREGKGRRCCLGGQSFIQFPCWASYFAPGLFEEYYEFILLLRSSWCNSFFSSYHPSAKQ